MFFVGNPKLSCTLLSFVFSFFFITQKGYKNDSAITSICSPSQEVLEYPQKPALILHRQKPYEARSANSIILDYLVLVQFGLVGTYFYSKQGLLPSFLVSMLFARLIKASI